MMKSAIILVLRGLMGGAIGGLIWMFLPAIMMGVLKDPSGLRLILFWYLFVFVWIMAALGGLIAFVIWTIHWTTGRILPTLTRICIGTAAASLAMAIYLFEHEPSLSLFNVWYPLFFGVAVGGLVGLLAGGPWFMSAPSNKSLDASGGSVFRN